MSDNLKNQLDNLLDTVNSYTFDSEKGWRELQPRIAQQRRSHKKIWLAAASVVLVISAITGVLIYQQTNKFFIPNELAEAHAFYQQAIAAKMQLVNSEPGSELILGELEELDLIFKELSEDLKDQVQNEEVVRAMIETYRIKLAILERIVSEIEEAKDEKVTEL